MSITSQLQAVIARAYDQLAPFYRLGFYEDLHYASEFKVRSDGLARLLESLPGRKLRRHVRRLGASRSVKLDLIRLLCQPIYRATALARGIHTGDRKILVPRARSRVERGSKWSRGVNGSSLWDSQSKKTLRFRRHYRKMHSLH